MVKPAVPMCQVNVGKFHNKGNCSEKLAEINDVNK